MTRGPAIHLERPSDPELRRQMARAEAEAASARFWMSCIRLILGGFVAVASGALAGAALWYVAGPSPDVPDLGPPLVTAAGDQAPESAAPVPEPQESAAPTPIPSAPAAALPAAPNPQAAPILVPDPSLQLSWMEEPPIEQDSPAPADGQGPPKGRSEAPTPDAAAPSSDRLLRKPTDRQIDTALAALDLDSLSPANIAPVYPPAWQRNAVHVAKPFDGPVIALVIDDLGLNRANTRRTIDLPGPLTLAFMTYAETLQAFADSAHAHGHELLVHFPMAPRDPRYDPGPNALSADLSPEELAQRLDWGLSRFRGYVGLNNHMGSGFTTSIPGMAQVMLELRARGLLYLDSLTVPGSVGAPLADRLGVPFAKRDVFIDNDFEDRAAIRRQLKKLERIALRRGAAIGIGHPHDQTLAELAVWLPEVQKRGFKLVPISALVRAPSGLAVKPKPASGPG